MSDVIFWTAVAFWVAVALIPIIIMEVSMRRAHRESERQMRELEGRTSFKDWNERYGIWNETER